MSILHGMKRASLCPSCRLFHLVDHKIVCNSGIFLTVQCCAVLWWPWLLIVMLCCAVVALAISCLQNVIPLWPWSWFLCCAVLCAVCCMLWWVLSCVRSLHDDVGHAIGFTRGSSNIGIPNMGSPKLDFTRMYSLKMTLGSNSNDFILVYSLCVDAIKRHDSEDPVPCKYWCLGTCKFGENRVYWLKQGLEGTDQHLHNVGRNIKLYPCTGVKSMEGRTIQVGSLWVDPGRYPAGDTRMRETNSATK